MIDMKTILELVDAANAETGEASDDVRLGRAATEWIPWAIEEMRSMNAGSNEQQREIERLRAEIEAIRKMAIDATTPGNEPTDWDGALQEIVVRTARAVCAHDLVEIETERGGTPVFECRKCGRTG